LEGFNPCFVGWYSGSHVGAGLSILQKEFQSLFCWMVFWKSKNWPLSLPAAKVSILVLLDGILEGKLFNFFNRAGAGFNPCFVGWYSGSSKNCPLSLPAAKVSILVLLDGILEEKLERETIAFEEFQSLFCWMVFWKFSKNWPLSLPAAKVSILVLLDGILEV
jgi:hypothetical protein